MRWSCPHCGTKLNLADEKMGPGWSFARCHSCQGHSLIRKAEVNIIKVDRAPTGENVLFPDPPEVAPPAAAAHPDVGAIRASIVPTVAPAFSRAAAGPPAVPVTDLNRRISPLVSVAIGVAGAMTVFSGIYLYLEGQELWEKTRPKAAIAERRAPVSPATIAAPAARVATASAPAPRSPELTDRVHQNAMAPIREDAPEATESRVNRSPAVLPGNLPASLHAGLMVQPKQEDVKLRSGPGLNFPVIGHGAIDLKYIVADWNDRWFRIVIPGSEQTAWIRNDLVQLTTK